MSFVCPDGKITGLLGPNGAGKTTVIKAITGAHYPDEGSISFVFDGKVLEAGSDGKAAALLTGFVGEVPFLYEDYTVREFILVASGLRAGSDENRENLVKRAGDVMGLCGLTDVGSQKISSLSHGYRQRVNFAQALVQDPKVLVLDEPSTGLDPSQIHEMRKLIKKISKERTILFSTHILQEAELLCDNIVIINHGQICAQGSVPELLKASGKKNLEEAYLFYVENDVKK